MVKLVANQGIGDHTRLFFEIIIEDYLGIRPGNLVNEGFDHLSQMTRVVIKLVQAASDGMVAGSPSRIVFHPRVPMAGWSLVAPS